MNTFEENHRKKDHKKPMNRTIIPIRFALVFCTFLLTVLLFVDRASISAAKVDICSDLGFGMTDFGWIMAVFTLGYALFQTPVGKLADTHGPRGIIAGIVVIWSFLVAITGAAWNFLSMLIIRFLFGAGEAGTYPSLSKVIYNWFPIKERGIIQGINFSGSRIGAAFAMPLVAWMIKEIGWRHSFLVFGAFGILYGILWYLMFRDKPENVRFIGSDEVEYIKKYRQQSTPEAKKALPFSIIIKSVAMWKIMVQYICSNFTFYFTITWMFTYIQERFQLGMVETGFYASVPLIAGAAGNWVGGILVDAIYRRGKWKLSRRLPAIIGFALSASGMIMVTQVSSLVPSMVFMSLAIFGADMTLSPSWAFCVDIGKDNAGAVSGTMNMAGNLGACVTIVAFPYMFQWTNRYEPFFIICAGLSLIAIVMWLSVNPEKSITNEP
jgi:ACS family glucarate transporter-like MFS transporter